MKQGKEAFGLDLILTYNWVIFISIEILSVVALLLFGVFRYFFSKRKLSTVFIFLFLLLLVSEGVLALFVYNETGEIETFQIVIAIFIVYAFTFGIVDFTRLDRWMREKIGKFRKVELLTEKDYRIMERNKDPKYIAKKYRMSSLIHLIVFVIAQTILWSMGTDSFAEVKMYMTDFSWVEAGTGEGSPYPNDVTFGIGVIWGLVFLIDFIYSWSYTIFPKK